MGPKCGELANMFADSHPSISRKTGRKKFEISRKILYRFTRHGTEFFHREASGAWGPKHVGDSGDSLVKSTRAEPTRVHAKIFEQLDTTNGVLNAANVWTRA